MSALGRGGKEASVTTSAPAAEAAGAKSIRIKRDIK